MVELLICTAYIRGSVLLQFICEILEYELEMTWDLWKE